MIDESALSKGRLRKLNGIAPVPGTGHRRGSVSEVARQRHDCQTSNIAGWNRPGARSCGA